MLMLWMALPICYVHAYAFQQGVSGFLMTSKKGKTLPSLSMLPAECFTPGMVRLGGKILKEWKNGMDEAGGRECS